MKRCLTICFLVIFFSIAILLNCYIATFAQDFDFNRSFNDYIYNYNLYRSAHLEYITAKSEFQTYNTLTSQTKALEATRKLLQQRDEALKTYLTALRMKLKEETGITSYKQNLYFVKLDDEVAWISQHQSLLTSPSTIEDLLEQSEKMENRYPTTTVISYQTLGTILEGKENSLRDKVNNLVKLTEEKINEIRANNEDTTIVERWLIEAKQKMTLSEQKQSQAIAVINTIEAKDSDKAEKYDQAKLLFEESNQYLKEAISFLKEIIREVKRV